MIDIPLDLHLPLTLHYTGPRVQDRRTVCIPNIGHNSMHSHPREIQCVLPTSLCLKAIKRLRRRRQAQISRGWGSITSQ
jgi:hypothetical protein